MFSLLSLSLSLSLSLPVIRFVFPLTRFACLSSFSFFFPYNEPLLCKFNIVLKHNGAFAFERFLLLFQKDLLCSQTSLCILVKTLLGNGVSLFVRT